MMDSCSVRTVGVSASPCTNRRLVLQRKVTVLWLRRFVGKRQALHFFNTRVVKILICFFLSKSQKSQESRVQRFRFRTMACRWHAKHAESTTHTHTVSSVGCSWPPQHRHRECDRCSSGALLSGRIWASSRCKDAASEDRRCESCSCSA